MLLFDLFFSSILQIWYVKEGICWSILVSPLDFEITRVDCYHKTEWNKEVGLVWNHRKGNPQVGLRSADQPEGMNLLKQIMEASVILSEARQAVVELKKEPQLTTNQNWSNNHACSLPHDVYVIAYLSIIWSINKPFICLDVLQGWSIFYDID